METVPPRSPGYFLWRIAYLALAIAMIFPAFRSAGNGTDLSWMLAVNKAFQNHFRFGEDVIFTYGPLGFLSTRLPAYIPHWIFLVFDLFFVGLILHILEGLRKRLPFKAWISYGLIILSLLSLCGIYFDNTFILKFAFFYLAYNCGLRNLILAAIVSLFSILIKISVGIILFAAFPIAVIISMIVRKITVLEGILLILSFYVAFSLLALALHISMPEYFIGALHLIGAYPDVMYMPPGVFNPWIYVWVALIILLLYVIFSVSFLSRRPKLAQVFVWLGISFYTFMIFKASFVRMDHNHILTFFSLMPFPLFFSIAYLKRLRPWQYYLLAFAAVISCAVPLRSPQQWRTILGKPRALLSYLGSLGEKPDQVHWAQFSKDYILPQNLKSAIGDSSTNVVPSELSILFYNKLKYRPSPAVQYFGWDPWLLEKNAAFFGGPQAPYFLFYGQRVLDNRYPLFDESLSLISIMQHYSLQSRFHDFLLLRKRNTPLDRRTDTLIHDGRFRFGRWFPVPGDSGILLLQAEPSYSLAGEAHRLFFQPPHLSIEIEDEGGQRRSYRLPKTFIYGGVILNKDVQTIEERAAFISSLGHQAKRIRAVRLISPNPHGFEKEIPFKLIRIEIY